VSIRLHNELQAALQRRLHHWIQCAQGFCLQSRAHSW
jgi:hypothetical protein